MKLFASLAIAAAFAVATPAFAAQPVYVMRHLQKEAGPDPALSAQGAAGAQKLAKRLRDKGIKAIFATATRRALQTGEPLAASLGLAVTIYDPADPAALAAAVASAGGPTLVVGHSNTVPDLVAALGGERPPEIADDEYETIYVIQPGARHVERVMLTP